MSSSLPSETIGDAAEAPITKTTKPRIFISYKRKAVDEAVALEVFRALEKDNDVFIDQTMPVGTHWADRIEAELRRSDFLVVFLSAQSVNSEMVKSEIATAHRLAQESNGRPATLPIRLAYQEPFQYPLSAYLDPINWAFWKGPEDTPHIIKELTRAIGGGELSIKSLSNKELLIEHSTAMGTVAIREPLPDAQPTVGKQKPLLSPHRPVDFKSDMYVVRDSDALAEDMIRSDQVTITIKGPEQRGKSSLLFRMLDAAKKIGKEVVFLDFKLLDRKILRDEDRFFREFCSRISDELDIEDKTEQYWGINRSNYDRCTLYMRKHILHEIGEKTTLVLAIDETETVADADYSDTFYTMLRNWHERRGWFVELQRLDMVFIVSTEPYRLIGDEHISPFNVGDPIELEDFSEAQVAALNRLHPRPLDDNQVKELYRLVCGHPYLARRALYMVSNRTYNVGDLFAKAADAYGPFGDHLRYHLFELRKKEDMLNELKHILRYRKSSDEMASHLLRGAGLIAGTDSEVMLRCPLYEQFFRRHLDVEN